MNVENVICQICKQEMSFGRIKRHISSNHKEILLENYLKLHWNTLPLHKPCECCGENIVYKYKTCSKECRKKLEHGLKGTKKPEGFGFGKKFKCSKENIKRPKAGGKGISRNKGKQPMLGKIHTSETKKLMSIKAKISFDKGERLIAKKGVKRSIETIQKILKHKKINNLEQLVWNTLVENNINFTFQFYLKDDKGNCKSYDFKIKHKPILLEIDGDYWPGNPDTKNHFKLVEETKINDIYKGQLAQDKGFTLLRFWEKDIKENPMIIIDKLKTLI
jgi:very-short-patch-repair endonuclease